MTKNKNPKITLFFLALLLLTACVQQKESPIEIPEQKPAAQAQNYIVNNQGDSIPTGVPIPIKGKLLNPDSFTVPVSVPFAFKPRITPATANVHTVGPPKIVPVPKKLTVKTPGKDGIPLPKRIAATGTILPIERTKSIRALAPKMKESATSNIQYWDMEEGLTYSIIRSLLQDRQGHLWIGTRDYGVSRFDGQYFTHFIGQAGETIAPLSMVEDTKGRIWMGSQGGLTAYDGTHFIQYKEEDGLNDNYVLWITTDSNNNLWMGTQNNGLSHFQSNEEGQGGYFTQYTEEVGLSHRRVLCVMEDKAGIIWFGTPKGLNRFDGEKFTHYTTKEGLSSDFVEYILEDKNGYLWIGTRNGLNRFDGQHFYQYTTEQGLTGNYIWTLYEDSEGYLWAGTFDNNGLMRFQPDEKGNIHNFTHYSTANGLSDNFVNRILEDSAHNLWVASGKNGLNRLNESHFTHFSTAFISGIAQNKKGHLWFSSPQSGLLRYDGENWSHIGETEGLPSSTAIWVYIDSQDNLWFRIPFYGVYKFEPGDNDFIGQLTQVSQPEGLSKNINAVLEDSRGHFWFSGYQGLYKYDGNNFIHFSPKEGLPSRITFDLFEDSQQNIWISMGERGLLRFTPNAEGTAGNFTLFTRAEGMSNHFVVNHIFEDSQGHLWFATNGGLNYFDGQRFIPMTIKEGLNHNIVQAIIEDKQQNIWISTYKGINLLALKANGVDSIHTSLLEKYTVHNLGKEDGLRDLRFTAESVHLEEENNLWWGTYKGITKIDLNTFKFSDTPPKVGLKTIEIGGNFIDYRKIAETTYQNIFAFGPTLSQSFDSVAPFENYPINLTIPHDLNHLTFHFSGIDWTAPHKIQYSYKIEGLDATWSSPQKEPVADYRNLPYGKHILKIRAKGEAQVWSESFDYPFTIRPPWWHTWWARLLYVLIGSSLIYGLFRWRTFNLRKQQKQLETTVTQRTAEVVEQQKRSDELLLNILPAEVAEELKATGQVQPVLFEEVSILFADFKGFTNIVASIPGKELVAELNEMFQHFDDIVANLGIEKIQTIGDAYVAACGLPKADANHAIKCVQAGKQMIDYLTQRNIDSSIKWEIRVGIHTGSITAGVVGKRKFAYDLFGDSINIAARIESAGAAGKINVSAYTHKLIKEQFSCTYRGKINAKGKGNLDMYFVE